MKAYVYHDYGGPEVVRLEDVAKPSPKAHEMRIKIQATTVTAADWRGRTLAVPRGFGPFARIIFGIRGPRRPILGRDFAGVVDAVGAAVTRYRPGDAVFGMTSACHAQYAIVAEDGAVTLKPESISFEEAAALTFGGSTALYFLGKAKVKPGEKALVVGASGDVGTAIVQLAKHYGAHVTGVTSTKNLELVRSLGADHVIDYTKEDFAASGASYDIIAETVGATTYGRSKHALRPDGRFLTISGDLAEFATAPVRSLIGGKKVIAGVAEETRDVVRRLAELARSGALRPTIDRRYRFTQMREAHAYVETRRKRGSVVVTVEHDE